MYRNQKEKHYPLSLERYFYRVFVDSTFNKQQDKNYSTDQHRILMPKGMNCKPRYPVDYDYARGMLITHKLWSKTDTLDKLLKDKQRTIDEFFRMLGEKEVLTSVQAQYLTAMKYSGKPKVEVLVKDGVNHPNTEDIQIDDETNERMDADSDEVKGSSKADSSDSDEVKGSSKADSSDSDSKECFTYNYHSKNKEKKSFGLRSGYPKKSIFSSSDEDDQSGNECVTLTCDWANEGKCIQGMVPIKCQYAGGGTKFVHHLCTIQWASENNVDEGGIATLCREHHPEYHQFCKQSSLVDSNRSGHSYSSSKACHQNEEYVSLKKVISTMHANQGNPLPGGENANLIQSFKNIAQKTGQVSQVMNFLPIDHDSPIWYVSGHFS